VVKRKAESWRIWKKSENLCKNYGKKQRQKKSRRYLSRIHSDKYPE
jgi:hypothetical protein